MSTQCIVFGADEFTEAQHKSLAWLSEHHDKVRVAQLFEHFAVVIVTDRLTAYRTINHVVAVYQDGERIEQ